MVIDWKAQLGEQLHGYWRALLRPGLERKLGRAAGPFSEEPFAVLVLHVNREVFHHAAEVALPRDLYRWRVAQ